MIKTLPQIYPDETLYSYFSRIYVRSGYLFFRGFSMEVFGRNELPINDYFVNVLTDRFLKLLDRNFGFECFLLEHTLIKRYLRFLPVDKRREALQHALQNKANLTQKLPFPTNRSGKSFHRYCPCCVEEDRKRFGEAYYHLAHEIDELVVCPIHGCNLINTQIDKTSQDQTSLFQPLEHFDLSKKATFRNENDINVIVAKYVNELFRQPLNLMTGVLIGDFLAAKLDRKYYSKGRGQRRLIAEIDKEIRLKYEALDFFDISKSKLKLTYRNESLNVFCVELIGLFENISPVQLANPEKIKEAFYEKFDNDVIKKYEEGMTIAQISKELSIHHTVISNIVNGRYSKRLNRKRRFGVKVDQ